MEQRRVKGTVTPLSSLFPPEEAQKAAKRVHDTFDERRKEVDQLQSFITDNTNLIKLVQKLPDELHHEIMGLEEKYLLDAFLCCKIVLQSAELGVPFGKAAFFPGRLIHTNEFLVLLGEGYYADRTSKQTTDILKRRGKSLESQVDSLKAVMQDLKAEALFFDSTVAESAEGLVEIIEDYTDEDSNEKTDVTGKKIVDSLNSKTKRSKNESVVEDKEYARMMLRIDELEKEELEAEKEVERAQKGVLSQKISELDLHDIVKDSEANSIKESQFHEDPPIHANVSSKTIASKVEGSNVHPINKGGSSYGISRDIADNSTELQDSRMTAQEVPLAKNEAFTGSIVERTYGFEQRKPKEHNEVAAPPSKPVSRFKMQRR